MNDCDGLLLRVMEQARALKIPFSPRIEPGVKINTRAVTRFGCCKLRKGTYSIEVARTVAEGPEKSCLEVLAHELLHTCRGCRDHGERWREYAGRMNRAYGYDIRRVTTNASLGVQGIRGISPVSGLGADPPSGAVPVQMRGDSDLEKRAGFIRDRQRA